MKGCSKFWPAALLGLGLMLAGTQAEAQMNGYSVTSSTNVIGVSNSLTYTIDLTNYVASFVYVTNTFPSTAQLLGATITSGLGTASTNANGFSFVVPLNTSVPVSIMTETVAPTQAGLFTNAITVVFFGITNYVTNLVAQVTTNTVVLPQADLAVAMTGPTSQVFSNDWMIYSVSVTNGGPNDAPGIFLTNTLPPGVGYKSVSPSNKTFTVSIQSSNVIFNLGTLTNGAFENFLLTVQPTNAGTLTFVSTVSTNGIFNPNPANNSASINVAVSNFLSNPGQLTATIVSTQKFNQLSGRLEQSVVVSNAGPTSVDSARLMVTGLTNLLSNATGTNNNHPFLTYASSLSANQSVYLLLQFYPNQLPFSFSNSQLQAVGVTLPDLTPAAGLTPTNVAFIGRLPSGGIILTFNSLTNRTYTVEYNTNLLSTNWLAAQPLTLTPATYTYWIDYGPPETVSHPTNTSMRFYRVLLNP
jgi:uncharacterized repeat protein (TIGR01451 family)